MTVWSGWKLTHVEATDHGGHQKRAEGRRRQMRREQEAVLAILRNQAPALYHGQPVKMNQVQVEALLAAITAGAHGHAYRLRHNFFIQGLAKGVREGLWQAPVPAPVRVLRRQPSPFTPQNFETLHQFNALYQCFLQSLSIRPESQDLQEWEIGQLLFSTIACGAILNPVWLCRFGPAAAKEPLSGKGHLWLDLEDEQGNLRRWFADPITGLLLLRFCRRHGGSIAQNWHTATAILKPIRRFFRQQGANSQPILKTLPVLLSAAKVWWQLRLPPYLVHYALSRDLAPSLPPESWIRLYGQRKLKLASSVRDDLDISDAVSRNRGHPSGYGDVLTAYRQVRRMFRNHRGKQPQVKALIEQLEQFLVQHHPPFLLQALIQWSIALMRTRRYATKKLKPSSVATYLSAIGPDLLAHGLSLEPEKVDWNDLYDAVLAAAPSAQARAYRSARLKEFHYFLQETYGVDAADLESEIGKGRVDANLITPAEYLLIRDYLLQDQRYSPRLRQIQSLLLTLGFRLGLRRSEAANLRIKDLQTNQGIGVDLPVQDLRPELLIRSNAYGTVKSTSSVRRLPLTLFSPDELTQLLKFEQTRLREIGDKACTDELLFCQEGEDRTPLRDAETFGPIRQAMYAVTGDPNLRFHHLRHSFANWLLLRLVAEDLPEALPEAWKGHEGRSGLPNRALPPTQQLLLNQGQPTAKKLYALSQLCGHVDPKETLASYLHLLDWILYQARCRTLPRLDNMAQAALMDVTPGRAKVFRHAHHIKIDDWLGLWRQRLAGLNNLRKDSWLDQSEPLRPLAPSVTGILPEGIQAPSPLLLYRILRQHVEERDYRDIAACFGFTPAQIERWIRTARQLGQSRTTKGKSRFVRRRSLRQTDLRREPALPDLCPAPPHREADRTDARRIYNRILALAESDWRSVETGLRLFLNHAVASESHIRFRRLVDQRAWVHFLQQIIPKSRLRLTLYPGSQPMEVQLQHWSKTLDVPRSQIVIHPNETSKSELGRVDVWVSQKAKPVVLPSSREADSWPAPGLKFALYMAAVYLGITMKNGGSTRIDPPSQAERPSTES